MSPLRQGLGLHLFCDPHIGWSFVFTTSPPPNPQQRHLFLEEPRDWYFLGGALDHWPFSGWVPFYGFSPLMSAHMEPEREDSEVFGRPVLDLRLPLFSWSGRNIKGGTPFWKEHLKKRTYPFPNSHGQRGSPKGKSLSKTSCHLLENIFFPLWVLRGIQHYWTKKNGGLES